MIIPQPDHRASITSEMRGKRIRTLSIFLHPRPFEGNGTTFHPASSSYIYTIMSLPKQPHPNLASFNSRSPQHLGNTLRQGFRHINEREPLFNLNRTDEVRIDVRFVRYRADQITGPDTGFAPGSYVETRHAGFTASNRSALGGWQGLSAMHVAGGALPMEAITLC